MPSLRILGSYKPIHATGKDFIGPVKLSNGWWVETHAGEENTISLAERLLEWCGHKDSDIRIILEK